MWQHCARCSSSQPRTHEDGEEFKNAWLKSLKCYLLSLAKRHIIVYQRLASRGNFSECLSCRLSCFWIGLSCTLCELLLLSTFFLDSICETRFSFRCWCVSMSQLVASIDYWDDEDGGEGEWIICGNWYSYYYLWIILQFLILIFFTLEWTSLAGLALNWKRSNTCCGCESRTLLTIPTGFKSYVYFYEGQNSCLQTISSTSRIILLTEIALTCELCLY